MYSKDIREKARLMRRSGSTHREIAKSLSISTSTVFVWCEDIFLTKEQSLDIRARTPRYKMNPVQRAAAQARLAQYRTKYTDEELLQRIRTFVQEYGRIPLKREFNAWDIYAARFGSWNAAVRKAGFRPNGTLFATKRRASDGHVCDSFSEALIDDWLTAHNIAHTRNAPYPDSRYTADFKVGEKTLIEFFGLAGANKRYDEIILIKRRIAGHAKCRLIELYPGDLYPTLSLDTALQSLILSSRK